MEMAHCFDPFADALDKSYQLSQRSDDIVSETTGDVMNVISDGFYRAKDTSYPQIAFDYHHSDDDERNRPHPTEDTDKKVA